jgi:hypothetical protein
MRRTGLVLAVVVEVNWGGLSKERMFWGNQKPEGSLKEMNKWSSPT